MRWKAVVFDLDDTLYPEWQYVDSGMRAVASWLEQVLGFPARRSFEELCRLRETAERGQTFNRWSEIHGLEPHVWGSRMLQTYRRHMPQIQPYPDVNAVLQRLSSRCRLGLVSDGYQETQRRKWTALLLDKYFQAVVFSDELGAEHWKPSPVPFRTVLDRLAVPAESAVYVGDNPHKDFRGARGIGMGTFRLRRDDGLYRALDLPAPDGVADAEAGDLFEIEAQLTQAGKGHRAPPLSI
jgi:putative hydrolase of the HAD superfamily